MRSTEKKKTKYSSNLEILFKRINMIQLCASPFPIIEKRKKNKTKTFKNKIIRVVEQKQFHKQTVSH